MSKYTPWTKEEAEAMAYNAVVKSGCIDENDKMRITEGFYACLAWAEEMIEACETVYWNEVNSKLRIVTKKKSVHDTHEANLVGVRPIDSDESGSKDQ